MSKNETDVRRYLAIPVMLYLAVLSQSSLATADLGRSPASTSSTCSDIFSGRGESVFGLSDLAKSALRGNLNFPQMNAGILLTMLEDYSADPRPLSSALLNPDATEISLMADKMNKAHRAYQVPHRSADVVVAAENPAEFTPVNLSRISLLLRGQSQVLVRAIGATLKLLEGDASLWSKYRMLEMNPIGISSWDPTEKEAWLAQYSADLERAKKQYPDLTARLQLFSTAIKEVMSSELVRSNSRSYREQLRPINGATVDADLRMQIVNQQVNVLSTEIRKQLHKRFPDIAQKSIDEWADEVFRLR